MDTADEYAWLSESRGVNESMRCECSSTAGRDTHRTRELFSCGFGYSDKSRRVRTNELTGKREACGFSSLGASTIVETNEGTALEAAEGILEL